MLVHEVDYMVRGLQWEVTRHAQSETVSPSCLSFFVSFIPQRPGHPAKFVLSPAGLSFEFFQLPGWQITNVSATAHDFECIIHHWEPFLFLVINFVKSFCLPSLPSVSSRRQVISFSAISSNHWSSISPVTISSMLWVSNFGSKVGFPDIASSGRQGP